MAKFIKDVHDLVNFLAGKSIATQQPPERIDAVLYEVVLDLFNTYYDHYVKTQKIDDYLLPFKKIVTVTVTSNVGELPPDYQHYRALRTVSGVGKVSMVPDKFWEGRKNSKVAPPSSTDVIAKIEMSTDDPPKKIIEVYPSQDVVLEYFKTPSKPLYAYTPSGSRYEYNDTTSVDIEFSPLLFNDIKKRVLSGLGINLRDRDLTTYSEQTKATDQLK